MSHISWDFHLMIFHISAYFMIPAFRFHFLPFDNLSWDVRSRRVSWVKGSGHSDQHRTFSRPRHWHVQALEGLQRHWQVAQRDWQMARLPDADVSWFHMILFRFRSQNSLFPNPSTLSMSHFWRQLKNNAGKIRKGMLNDPHNPIWRSVRLVQHISSYELDACWCLFHWVGCLENLQELWILPSSMGASCNTSH